jgi:hypothetical protein
LDAIVIQPHGMGWAVKHNDSFLGFTKSREEAVLVARDLQEWLEDRGREATLDFDASKAVPHLSLRRA